MNLAPVLVLGMHRSGTSCLAGCLEEAGLVLGQVNTSATFNARGNREHEDIRGLHDRLLSWHGYAWDRPPPRQLDWREIDLQALSQKTQHLANNANWGLKDPRVVFCLKGWLTLYTPRFVATYRHPEAVAASLMRRAAAWKTPMTRETALGLWNAYNAELLAVMRQHESLLIRYDCAPIEYAEQIRSMAVNLGLNGEAAMQFHSTDLTHHDCVDAPIPAACQTVWAGLEAMNSI